MSGISFMIFSNLFLKVPKKEWYKQVRKPTSFKYTIIEKFRRALR
jgi:hypothetical protein